MSLTPLLHASPAIQIHAFAAMTAFALGLVQLLSVKGNTRHRAIGYVWVALMAIIAVSSFWIQTIHQIGPYSVIHILSVIVIVSLPVAILHARAHRVGSHKRAMLALFGGALAIAGIFTFVPGRLMYKVVFGG